MAKRQEILKIVSLFTVFSLFTTQIFGKPTEKGAVTNPVILVPGDGGSQFFAKLSKPSVIHYWCSQHTTAYFSLWLNLEMVSPFVLDCFVDNLRLVYNETSRKTSNSPGVDIQIREFGNTSSVEWLDPSQVSPTSYFSPIANALVKAGYQRGKSIRGAPYDFRKAPNELQDFFVKFKALVEDTYKINDNKKVVFVCHSMGNVMMLYFLNQQKQSWKDKFVSSMISLSGPWGGAAKTLRLMASGDNLGLFVVNPFTVRPEQRSMPSSAWLLPYDNFWDKDEIVVSQPNANYTVHDYKQFFEDIKFPNGFHMREDTKNLLQGSEVAPGIEVHCMNGIKVQTPASFKYSAKQWPDRQPDTIYGDGDGTVNQRSLYGFKRWQSKQKQKITHTEYAGVDHMQILGHDKTIADIRDILGV
ncbi:unnamed protein product [Owenia fusiformis]|uniref:Uncharacterized protein n=1 Tax=Owenia fusiformis TaxID=6347 RepID=A0A8J1UTL5_OWEFU|nr:unnamed protein product [Owenia fusiformis]